MPTFEELLRSKQSNLPEQLKEVADKSDLDRLLSNPMSANEIDTLNSKPDVLDKMVRAAKGDYTTAAPAASSIPVTTAVPVGEPVSNTLNIDKLKEEFLKQRASNNMGQMVGEAKTLSPSSDVLKKDFLTKTINDIPDDMLAKLGKMGETIKTSRAAQLASKIAPVAEVIGGGLELSKTPQIAANAESKILGDAPLKTKVGAGLKSLGNAAIVSSLPVGALGTPLAGVLTATAGVGAKSLGEYLDPAEQQESINQIAPPNGRGPLADASQYKPQLYSTEQLGPSEDLMSKPEPSQLTARVKSSVSEKTRSPATESDQVSALQAMLNPAQGGFTNNTVENLKKVQDEQEADHNDARLTNALNLVGTSIAGLGSGAVLNNTLDGYYKDRAKDETKVKNFQALTDKEKDDPGSTYSVGMREFAKPMMAKLGIKLPDNMSAEQMSKVSPLIVKMYDARQADETNRLKASELNETRRMHDMLMSEDRKDKKAAKDDDSSTRRLDTLGKTINAQIASSRSGFGKDANNLNAIQNVKALLEGESNLDNIDNRQVAEVARVLDRVLSNGNPTISGTEHLTPETARMAIAKRMEYVTNQRKGAGAGSFLKNVSHTLDREENVAKDRIRSTSQSIAGSYLDLADKNPERWDALMAQHNLLDVLGSDALQTQKAGGLKNVSETKKSPNLTTSSKASEEKSSKIKVTNGKETLMIDSSDLQHAKDDGYTEVK